MGLMTLDVEQERRNILECILGYVMSDEPDARKLECIEGVLEYWTDTEDAAKDMARLGLARRMQ